MNPIFSAFLVALILCLNVKADCPVGPYTVRYQEFLNQFKETYVDCQQLDGLVIKGGTAYSLAPRSDIKKIKGDVIFQESFHFKSLAGMSALKEIDGSLIVDDMDSVIDFAGFETLERIGGKLEITRNPSLNTLFKTTSLMFLGLTPESDLIIEDNPALVALEGLTSLNEVKGCVSIQRNKVLANLDGLKGLVLVDSTVRISWNENLRNLDGLKNLETCNDTLVINRNALLESVDLQALKHARNWIAFSQNPELRRIDGANAMTTFNGDLIIQGHLKLDTIRAFNGLVEVGKGIEFTNNTGKVADFRFLGNLKRVGGSIDIMTSNQQIALTGLDSLSRVGHNFTLRTLAPSLSGLENLKYVGTCFISEGIL